jgi:hypothetical protein
MTLALYLWQLLLLMTRGRPCSFFLIRQAHRIGLLGLGDVSCPARRSTKKLQFVAKD